MNCKNCGASEARIMNSSIKYSDLLSAKFIINCQASIPSFKLHFIPVPPLQHSKGWARLNTTLARKYINERNTILNTSWQSFILTLIKILPQKIMYTRVL